MYVNLLITLWWSHVNTPQFWDIFHSKVALNFLSLIDILFAMLKFLVFPLIQTGGLRIEAVCFWQIVKLFTVKLGFVILNYK